MRQCFSQRLRLRVKDRNAAQSRERGAVLVEYTLILAVFVLVSVGAVGVMNENADAYFEDSSDHIGSPVNRFEFDEDGNRPGANTLASTTTVTAPPTTSTTTTSTTTIASTTTLATTTTVATTTTTVPATTTTFVTTTTQPSSVSTTIEDISTPQTDSNKWDAKARVTVIGSPGVDVSGIPLTGSFTKADGTIRTRSCTTDASGTCTMAKNNSGRRLAWWDFEITSVGGPVPWTGTESALRINKP